MFSFESLRGKAVLAPMAGVGDSAFRTVCAESGAACTVTEMVSAKALHYGDENTAALMFIRGAERPCGIQLFGSEPEIMAEGVKAHPDVIKPNADECAALVGFIPKTRDEFLKATDELRKVCGCPIVSDGGAGAWFDGEFAAAPAVDVVDTTAAGDTLLAEWCWRRYGAPCKDAAGWAVAAGSAACTMPGGAPPDADLVARLKALPPSPPRGV